MEHFWEGFEKRAEAARDELDEWVEESLRKSEKGQPKNLNISPQVASQSFTPDTYWRSWP